MVGYDPKQVELATNEKVLVSFGTSFIARFLIQPFDVVKIRFQCQYEPISKKSGSSKYKSVGQTFVTIVREEGLTALWKGHLTGQVLSASFTSAHFLWFEFLTHKTAEMWPRSIETESRKFATHFACGGLAATFTMLTNQPIDVIRTRFAAQGEPRLYTSIADACRKIYAHEGMNGFYKGMVPSIILVTPETAFRFGIYQLLNSLWSRYVNRYLLMLSQTTKSGELDLNRIGGIQSGVNGSISGILAKTLVYPFDLAKKRLQIQGFEEARKSFGKVIFNFKLN
jgi:solute carrier family 25 thiamine pyrophosphate transporter 19